MALDTSLFDCILGALSCVLFDFPFSIILKWPTRSKSQALSESHNDVTLRLKLWLSTDFRPNFESYPRH